MALKATIKWSESQFQYGKSARRVYQVSGCKDENDAWQATGQTLSSPHPLDARLTLRDYPVVSKCMTPPTGTPPSGGFYEVTCDYKAPEGGGGSASDLTPRYSRVTGRITEPWEIGYARGDNDDGTNRNALLINANGDLFQGLTRERIIKYITIIRWEAQLDESKADAFEDTVNAEDFSFDRQGGGRIIIPKRQARFISIQPTGVLRKIDPIVEVAYSIEWKKPASPEEASMVENDQITTWDARLAHMGFNGWYSDSGVLKPGKYMDGNGVRSDPICLKEFGAPLRSGFKIEGNRDPVFSEIKNYFLAEKPVGGLAEFVWYGKYEIKSWAGLEF